MAAFGSSGSALGSAATNGEGGGAEAAAEGRRGQDEFDGDDGGLPQHTHLLATFR